MKKPVPPRSPPDTQNQLGFVTIPGGDATQLTR